METNNGQLTDRARAALELLVTEIGELRPLPASAQQVLKLTAEDRFSAYELANVIASDQALTAKMLRLSNSAYYGFPRRITTMRDAVVLLGFRQVRAATVTSCVIEAMPASNHIAYQQFWQYSLTVGMLSEVLARADRQAPDEAFTAGVLHNVGRLALDQHRPTLFGEAQAYAAHHGVSLHKAQLETLGFTDAQLGEELGKYWDFPAPLLDAVAHHDRRPDQLTSPHSLVGFVVRARAFARSYGASDGVEQPQALQPPADEWLEPPVAPALKQAGGMDALRERASAFLQHAGSN
ncbi:MAG: HDOD domain-containing protein [Chloroflexi bacterium]|nr:MAG: HDOD domain-containing protein [Chloroflexota bacterium]